MQSSELILNSDGSIYHLHLHPEDVAETIITVGDPNRVASVSKHFDRIDVKKAHREFVTHTGWIGSKRLTVISTGIGTDNIDIVLNELDALFNIDLNTRMIKPHFTPLQFIRIGTSGCLRAEIPIDSFLVSEYAIGLDGLMFFYKNYTTFEEELLKKAIKEKIPNINFYCTDATLTLSQAFKLPIFQRGITLTCSGFYAPQMRQLRLPVHFSSFFDDIVNFSYNNCRITNMEMETSGIYLLAKMLGHEAISINALLANRITGEFSQNPQQTINKLIRETLDIIVY